MSKGEIILRGVMHVRVLISIKRRLTLIRVGLADAFLTSLGILALDRICVDLLAK
jgi:hypothetical protein